MRACTIVLAVRVSDVRNQRLPNKLHGVNQIQTQYSLWLYEHDGARLGKRCYELCTSDYKVSCITCNDAEPEAHIVTVEIVFDVSTAPKLISQRSKAHGSAFFTLDAIVEID